MHLPCELYSRCVLYEPENIFSKAISKILNGILGSAIIGEPTIYNIIYYIVCHSAKLRNGILSVLLLLYKGRYFNRKI